MNRSRRTLGHVTVMDGTSNTLMFGETLGGTGIGGRNHAHTWMGSGAMPTGWGLGRGNQDVLNGGADWFRFSSRHPGGVQFCFGDGSVRLVHFGTTTEFFSDDWKVLAQLSGVNDGQAASTEGLLD